jgi:hypothetical protein
MLAIVHTIKKGPAMVCGAFFLNASSEEALRLQFIAIYDLSISLRNSARTECT